MMLLVLFRGNNLRIPTRSIPTTIKKELLKKQELLEVLNFLVEKGSAIGYMLRERIL